MISCARLPCNLMVNALKLFGVVELVEMARRSVCPFDAAHRTV